MKRCVLSWRTQHLEVGGIDAATLAASVMNHFSRHEGATFEHQHYAMSSLRFALKTQPTVAISVSASLPEPAPGLPFLDVSPKAIGVRLRRKLNGACAPESLIVLHAQPTRDDVF